jgi:DNA-binding helix-hairpin-helix protein with protein kinase domain
VAIILASTNQAISLGSLLSKGGEGSVYVLPSMPGFVAKTYHGPLEVSQQRKLKYMVGLGDEKIFLHAAWPTDCLLSADRSAVVGMVMHHIHGMAAVHAAYNAKSRKKHFPYATWEFLLWAARNTAAAFETVHSRGHVVGDINESNILVGPKASVRLLDCDSFQISTNGEIHDCRVGVSAFTPPELQGKSFAGIRRTSNHDGFGLAVIIFHLLFNGRHPFAGRPVRPDVGGEPAENIAAFRFAYADDNVARGLVVPPKASPLTLVPPQMRLMFHRAFTEDGLKYGRPTAAEWLDALDDCLGMLMTCSAHSGHVYPDHLKECPWCELLGKGLRLFPDHGNSARGRPTRRAFDYKKWQATLRSISLPPPIDFPVIHAVVRGPTVVYPNSLQCFARWAVRGVFLAAFVVFASGGLVVPAILSAVAVAGAWVGMAMWEREQRASRRHQSQAKLAAANAKWVGVQKDDAGHSGLRRIRKELKDLCTKFEAKQQLLAQTKKEAVRRAEAQLLRVHLMGFHIGTADIPKITSANRQTLQSFFMWNAYDVAEEKVAAIPGFGQVKTAEMVEWKRRCVASFRVEDSALQTILQHDANLNNETKALADLGDQMEKGLRTLRERVSTVRDDSRDLQRLVTATANELQEVVSETAGVEYASDWQTLAKTLQPAVVRFSGFRRMCCSAAERLGRECAKAGVLVGLKVGLAVAVPFLMLGVLYFSGVMLANGKRGRDGFVDPPIDQTVIAWVRDADIPGQTALGLGTPPGPVATPPEQSPRESPLLLEHAKEHDGDAQLDPISAELRSALKDVKRAIAAGNTDAAIACIKSALIGKKDVPSRYFDEWQDLMNAGRDALLLEANQVASTDGLTVHVVDAERNAANILRLLMREMNRRGEREQASAMFLRARSEYRELMSRVAKGWKTGRVTRSMDQERAVLLEYDAMLHRDYCDVQPGQQSLNAAIKKYEECVRFRRAYLESDPRTEQVQKALDSLKAAARKQRPT